MLDDALEISVSIVTFNNADVLRSRLELLLPIFKTNGITEVIIIDNASTDETKLILQEFAKKYSLLKLILLKENKGYGYGHNQAIRKVESKYHIVMNLDTTPIQKYGIFKMGQYMDIHPDIHLLSPLVRYPNGKIQHLNRKEPTIFDLGIRFLGSNWFRKRQDKFMNLKDGYDHEQIIKNATGSFMFLRTVTLKSIGGFDERFFLYMEDSDLTKEINTIGKAVFSPKFEVVHEWQRMNHSFNGSLLMIRSMIKYFNKWGWVLF